MITIKLYCIQFSILHVCFFKPLLVFLTVYAFNCHIMYGHRRVSFIRHIAQLPLPISLLPCTEIPQAGHIIK